VEVVISGIFGICQTRLARWLVEQIPLRIVGPVFDSLRRAWKCISKPTKRRGLANTRFIVHQSGHN
jgi:coenzyme F420 hydrogenase subunit beta